MLTICAAMARGRGKRAAADPAPEVGGGSLVGRVRSLARSLLRGSHGRAFVPLAAAKYADEHMELDVWSLTEGRRVVVPTRSVLLCNVLRNLAGAAAQHAQLAEDEGDLRWLAEVDDAFAAGFITRCADEHGRQFEVLPEQLATAMAIARGPSTGFRSGNVTWYSPKPGSCASFAVLSSAPGSGKTAIVLLAALHAVGAGWGECEAGFAAWKKRAVNNDPLSPERQDGGELTAGDSSHVARGALLVATRSTYAQWEGALKHTLALMGPGAPKFSENPVKEMIKAPGEAVVGVIRPAALKTYYKKHWDTGCVFVALDEIATHAQALPTGHYIGHHEFPSVYRMVGMSATFMRLFEARVSFHGANKDLHVTNEFIRLGPANVLKCMLMAKPGTRIVPAGEALRDTWRRVAVATAAPAMQLSLSASLASRTVPAVAIHNLRVTAHTLADVLKAWTAIESIDRLPALSHIGRGHLKLETRTTLQELLDGFLGRAELDKAALLYEGGRPGSGQQLRDRLTVPAGAHFSAMRFTQCIGLSYHTAFVARFGLMGGNALFRRLVLATTNDHPTEADVATAATSQNGLAHQTLRTVFRIRHEEPRVTEGEFEPVACGGCGASARLATMMACPDCTGLLCGACSGAHQGAGCPRCQPAAMPADVYAAQRGRTLGLVEGLAWALAGAAGASARRVIAFGATEKPPAELGQAARLAGVELTVTSGSDAVEAFKVAQPEEGMLLLYLADKEDETEAITGVNLGNAQAIIVLNRLSDEQQAFSRALRMMPEGADIPDQLPVFRLLHGLEPAGDVRTAAPAGRAPDPPSDGEDLEFARKAFFGCCAPEEEMLNGDADMLDVLPDKVIISIAPASRASRLREYELDATLEAVAGAVGAAEGAAFEVVFSHNLKDPFVPADAAGLRVRNQDGRVRACWVQATRAPAAHHPEVPSNQLKITIVTKDGVTHQTQAWLESGDEDM